MCFFGAPCSRQHRIRSYCQKTQFCVLRHYYDLHELILIWFLTIIILWRQALITSAKHRGDAARDPAGAAPRCSSSRLGVAAGARSQCGHLGTRCGAGAGPVLVQRGSPGSSKGRVPCCTWSPHPRDRAACQAAGLSCGVGGDVRVRLRCPRSVFMKSVLSGRLWGELGCG